MLGNCGLFRHSLPPLRYQSSRREQILTALRSHKLSSTYPGKPVRTVHLCKLRLRLKVKTLGRPKVIFLTRHLSSFEKLSHQARASRRFSERLGGMNRSLFVPLQEFPQEGDFQGRKSLVDEILCSKRLGVCSRRATGVLLN